MAEDDPELRCGLVRTLELWGFEVRAVASGLKLLQELANVMVRPLGTRPYDVIVTDLRMPGRSGLSIITGLRRGGWTGPLVVISAFGDATSRARVERLGATFLAKPIELGPFERLLDRLCAGSREAAAVREQITGALAGAASTTAYGPRA